MDDLEVVIRRGLEAAPSVDLFGCIYGPPHWDSPSSLEPPPNCGLLAGLAKTCRCERILELGTDAGGATLAMVRTLPDTPAARIVTVDVTSIANGALDADQALRGGAA